MSRLMIVSLFLFGLLLTTSSAQDKEKVKEAPPKKVEIYPKTGTGGAKSNLEPAIPGDCEIHFLNGSKVRMVVQSEKLDVATAYGKLSVPVKDVRAIEFGLHFPEGMEPKIEAAVKSLNSGDYREREKANLALIELGPYSYPAVLEASRMKELEVSKRAKEVLVKLVAKHPKKDLKTMVEDKVVTQNFTIVGRILTTTVKAKTEYFGEQELNLAKMRTLRAMGGGSLDMELSIDSGKYANQGQWLDTGYQCDGRTAISITATGMIDVWPQQGGQFMCGPAGFQQSRNGNNPGGMIKGGRKIGNVLNGQIHCGMLIGKIGEDGEFFMIGDRFDALPETEGKLYLHIGPSQWNVQCIGSFEVKINRKTD
jgi:hypothetical protein